MSMCLENPIGVWGRLMERGLTGPFRDEHGRGSVAARLFAVVSAYQRLPMAHMRGEGIQACIFHLCITKMFKQERLYSAKFYETAALLQESREP